MKAPWYEKMSRPPLGIFALTDQKAHSGRRRLLSHVFSRVNLLETEPLVAQQIQNLKKRVQAGLGKHLNMHALFRSFSLDVVGELFLGKSFEALQAKSTPQFLHDVDSVFLLFGIEAAFPWIHLIICSLPFASVKHFIRANERMADYGKKAFFEYIARYGRESGRRDLLTKFMTMKPEDGDITFTDTAAWREVGNLVHAGTDTTSTTLTYLFWELARHSTWQERLRKELDDNLSTTSNTIPTLLQVQDLPILDAIVKEALRLHPAAPASLPRVVPAGGSMLDGHFMPEHTVVSMQCYTTQRNPLAFPHPDKFDPARWLNTDKITDQMRELFMPFSKGTRACLGKNLAAMELKLTTTVLIREFRVGLAPSATEECMTMTDHFLVIPKGGMCELVMEGVSGKG